MDHCNVIIVQLTKLFALRREHNFTAGGWVFKVMFISQTVIKNMKLMDNTRAAMNRRQRNNILETTKYENISPMLTSWMRKGSGRQPEELLAFANSFETIDP